MVDPKRMGDKPAVIRDIADRGASSWDPAVVGYALQELSQVLLERTGEGKRRFEPVPADEIQGLDALLAELQWVEDSSRELCQMSSKADHRGRSRTEEASDDEHS
jgi:hypothetical protein